VVFFFFAVHHISDRQTLVDAILIVEANEIYFPNEILAQLEKF
jgi:hypothetical protein